MLENSNSNEHFKVISKIISTMLIIYDEQLLFKLNLNIIVDNENGVFLTQLCVAQFYSEQMFKNTALIQQN